MNTTRPTKEQVRYWQDLRHRSQLPPGPPEEIRRQLGWGLVRAAAGATR